MYTWDYKLKKDWKPRTRREWLWYLERKINYDDWRGLRPEELRHYFPYLHIPPGKKLVIRAYLTKYAKKAI